MLTKKTKGRCINCSSINLDYKILQTTEYEECFYPYVCFDCGKEGRECYKMVYVETESVE